MSYGIQNFKSSPIKLIGFYDSDLRGCVDDVKGTFSYAFHIGPSVFSWSSRKQQSVAQLSAEAEFILTALDISQAFWLKIILEDLGEKKRKVMEYFWQQISDNNDKESHFL